MKYIIFSLNILVLFISLVSSTTTYSSTTGSLTISGVVPEIASITSQVEVSLSHAAIRQGGEFFISGVTEISNSPNGYTVSLYTRNGGLLLNGNKKVKYDVIYNGIRFFSRQLPSSSNSAIVVKKTNKFITTINNSELSVFIDRNPNAKPGIYSDTIYLNIVSNY